MQEFNENDMVRVFSLPLYNAKFWMQLFGVIMIISGALAVLSIVGIIYAWLPIWMGVLLMQSAGSVKLAYENSDADAAVRAQDKLKTFFIVNGVVILVSIILTIIGFVFFGSMIASMMQAGMHNMPQM